MKKLLLLGLLLGFPSPLFAGSTDGYKQMYSCTKGDIADVYLMKKEDSNSKKWGVHSCTEDVCSWADKAVSYDTAVDKYNEKSSKLPCKTGTLSIDN